MAGKFSFTLSYTGRASDRHEIDFYDISDALYGFQRYIALTTHLFVNNEIITHAPALKNARIYAAPPEDGSWKILANVTLLCAAAYNIGTADKETPVGNIGRSIYEYVLKESIGIEVDYDKSIGEEILEARKKNPNFPELTQSKLDSLIEKCQSGIYKIHRPIVSSRTANRAEILFDDGSGDIKSTGSLDKETHDYMSYNKKDDRETVILGRITSYNVNTFKGRIYIVDEKRPVPFVIAEGARSSENVDLVTSSLKASAFEVVTSGDLRCFVYKTKSRTDRLKHVVITNVLRVP